jgi:hypothetical protein
LVFVREKEEAPIVAVRLTKIGFGKLVKAIGLLSGKLGRLNTRVPEPISAGAAPVKDKL